jgi:hypothetical protein
MDGIKVDLKTVPQVVWICATIAFLAIVAAFVALGITGANGTDFRSFINTAANLGGLLLTGSGAIYAGVAARNSQSAKEQTNGQLDARIAKAVAAELVAHGNPKNLEVSDNGGPTV